MTDETTHKALEAGKRVDEAEAIEASLASKAGSQAAVTDLTDAHIASEKSRPHNQIQDLLQFHENRIAKETDKLERCKSKLTVDLGIEKDAYRNWKATQEALLSDIRAEMTVRKAEYEADILAIKERAEADIAGHNEYIARCKSFINGGAE